MTSTCTTDTQILFFFVPAGLGALAWLIFSRRFILALRERYGPIYEKLGRPPLAGKRFYTASEVAGTSALLSYLLAAGYRETKDERLIRFGDRLRVLLVVEFLLLAMVFGSFYFAQGGGSSGRNPGVTQDDKSYERLRKAYDLSKQGKLDKALGLLDEEVTDNPGSAQARFYRGAVLEKQGRLPEALEDFRSAASLDGSYIEPLFHIDYIYARQGDWSAVIAAWDRFIAANPENARAWLERGGAYYRMGDLPNALRNAEESCRLGNSEACSRRDMVRSKLRSAG